MSKERNNGGKLSHWTRSSAIDRSIYWKHGKTSGDGTYQAKKKAKLAKRGKDVKRD